MAQESPVVSIVIPAYNAEAHLLDCLVSVEVQSYPSWEAIVIDDGSTDRTREIALNFARRCVKPVKVVSTTNSGLSAARNRGIAESSGSLIALLDSDDVWSPTKLTLQVELLEKSRNCIATTCGAARFLDGDPNTYQSGTFVWSAQAVRDWMLLIGPAPGLGSTLLMRKEAMIEIGPFDTSLGSYAEDLDYAFRMVEFGYVESPPEVLVGLRVWRVLVGGGS